MSSSAFPHPRVIDLAEIGKLRSGLKPATGPLRITHVVNPFPPTPGSEHDRAQTVTLAAMDRARRVAAVSDPDVTVRQIAVVLPGEAPEDAGRFDDVLTLGRSVLDLGSFARPRPLPLHCDIVCAPDLPDDEILIYTNIDIAPTDSFYGFVAQLFRDGFDAAIINRRNISDSWTGAEDLPLMVAEVGQPHQGADCFAFRAGLRARFLPWDGCVGIGHGELPLVQNLMVFAEAPCMLLDAHATLHIGSVESWLTSDFADFFAHNRTEADRVFDHIHADPALWARLTSALRLDRRAVGLSWWQRAKVGLQPPDPLWRRVLRRARRLTGI